MPSPDERQYRHAAQSAYVQAFRPDLPNPRARMRSGVPGDSGDADPVRRPEDISEACCSWRATPPLRHGQQLRVDAGGYLRSSHGRAYRGDAKHAQRNHLRGDDACLTGQESGVPKWYNDTHLEQILRSTDHLGAPIRTDRRKWPIHRDLRADCDDLDAAAQQMGKRKLTGLDHIAMDPSPFPTYTANRVARTVTLPATFSGAFMR